MNMLSSLARRSGCPLTVPALAALLRLPYMALSTMSVFLAFRLRLNSLPLLSPPMFNLSTLCRHALLWMVASFLSILSWALSARFLPASFLRTSA